MKTEVFLNLEFSAAHSLPHLPKSHKCHRKHGHNYRVEIGITKEDWEDENALGWLVDYALVESIWMKYCFSRLDHRDLDDMADIISPSTSELVAQWIGFEMGKHLPPEVKVSFVKLWETPRFGAIWTP